MQNVVLEVHSDPHERHSHIHFHRKARIWSNVESMRLVLLGQRNFQLNNASLSLSSRLRPFTVIVGIADYSEDPSAES